MIPLARCRELLGNPTITDVELEAIRDHVTTLAEVRWYKCPLDADQLGVCMGGACMVSRCGDGVIDERRNEECDAGEDNSDTEVDRCRNDCKPARCGDAVTDMAEVCDDGNFALNDGCSPDCLSDETCGNGIVDFATGETCDDGDLQSRDGCSSGCIVELPTWTMAGLAAPSARFGPVVANDASRQLVVLFGGSSAAGLLNDTWEFDGTRWVAMTPSASPPARDHSALAFAGNSEVVLFGGLLPPGNTVSNDTWKYGGGEWSELTIASPPQALVTSIEIS